MSLLSAEREYWRHKCRDSFWWFFKYAYGYDFNPEGGMGKRWLREETHRDAFTWFENLVKPWLEARKSDLRYDLRLAMVVPRDWGKTTIFTQAGMLWLHLHDVNISTYFGSEDVDKSEKWMSSPMKVFNGEDKSARFAWLYGSGYSPERRWKQNEVVSAFRTNLTKKEPSFTCWGVAGGATGDHPDVGSLDDPTSIEKLTKNSNWSETVEQHLASLIPVFENGSLLMLPGTRYGSEDQYGTVFRNDGIKSISGMTIAEDGKPYRGDVPDFDVRPDGLWHVYYLSAEEPETKRLTMPHIWSREKIDRFDNADPQLAASQVRNDPTNHALAPITKKQVFECVRGRLRDYDWKRMYISIHMDTAFKKAARVGRGDETVLQIWGHTRDAQDHVVYRGGWGDNKMNADTLRDLIFEKVEDLRAAGCYVRCITDENEPGGKSEVWERYLRSRFTEKRKIMPPFIYLHRQPSADAKYRRMVEAAGYWKRGFVIIPEDAEGISTLLSQMWQIGTSKHKDWADCAADVFHAKVHDAMIAAPESEPITFLDDPFADIKEPGIRGVIAADKVAEFYAQQEREMQWVDPI